MKKLIAVVATFFGFAPKLGLAEAEEIFRTAPPAVKANPEVAIFAIVAAARVLGATVCVNEEGNDALNRANDGVAETEKNLSEVTAGYDASIAALEEEIRQAQAERYQLQEEAELHIHNLERRSEEVRDVMEFFGQS